LSAIDHGETIVTKRIARNLFVAAVTAVLVACVTINVYFPEAAAERAADRFIQDVIGPPAETEGALHSRPDASSVSRVASLSFNPIAILAGIVIPSAHAQSVNIDVEGPQINAIKQRMVERQREHLAAWLDAGAIGLDNTGLIEIRDRSAVPLSERRQMEQIVAEENADRRAVYREIAVANGHPEWEERIRETFADRWIVNARPGWYYQDESGSWQRK
jgi:uncharacterized protein YdbL (DUF1318 family)